MQGLSGFWAHLLFNFFIIMVKIFESLNEILSCLVNKAIDSMRNELTIALVLPHDHRNFLFKGLKDRTWHALTLRAINKSKWVPENLQVDLMRLATQINDLAKLRDCLQIILLVDGRAQDVNIDIELLDDLVELC